jgi:hypothetical protein
MAPLTLLMLYEKTGPSGDRAARPIGLALIMLGALVQAHPAWLPSVLGG